MVLKIREKLLELSEKSYVEFMEKLIPGSRNILGVRIRNLRKIARDLFKTENWEKYVLSEEVFYQEEFIIQGMLIGLERRDYKKVISLCEFFIPKIKNWAVCDSFCSELKIVKKYKKETFEFLKICSKTKEEYRNRFVIVMLLKYFIDDYYLERAVWLLTAINEDGYYVKMAKAWFLAEAFARYPQEIGEYIQSGEMDRVTFKMTIQKICDSTKITKEQKRNMKNIKGN